jgi:hypothetical protein
MQQNGGQKKEGVGASWPGGLCGLTPKAGMGCEISCVNTTVIQPCCLLEASAFPHQILSCAVDDRYPSRQPAATECLNADFNP